MCIRDRLCRLQSVLNAAVRLVFSARKFDHTTPLLCGLHWLKVPESIKFRLCVLTYRCFNCIVPHYLAETIRPVSKPPIHWDVNPTGAVHVSFDSRRQVIHGGCCTGMEHLERAFSSCFPPRTEDLSVPVVISWCDLTMNCALFTCPLLNAVMSPCTGCYKPFLLLLYGGLAAAMR